MREISEVQETFHIIPQLKKFIPREVKPRYTKKIPSKKSKSCGINSKQSGVQVEKDII